METVFLLYHFTNLLSQLSRHWCPSSSLLCAPPNCSMRWHARGRVLSAAATGWMGRSMLGEHPLLSRTWVRDKAASMPVGTGFVMDVSTYSRSSPA